MSFGRAGGRVAGWTVAALVALPVWMHGRACGQERDERGGGRERGGERGGERGRGRGPGGMGGEGRGRGRGQMPPFGRPQMGGQPAPAMAVSDGKLYIVNGRDLQRLDAETLEKEKKAEIPLPPEMEERMTRVKEMMLKRLDKDGDGYVSQEEFPRPEFVERMDTDGDGKVSKAELNLPGMARPTGPTTLLVEKGSVYVFQSGWLYRFDAESLELGAKSEIAPEQRARQGRGGPPGGGERDRGPGARRDRPRQPRGRTDRRGDEPTIPKGPDEPAAF
ncbi:MAG: EF-hand domain-containing protein [Planctomycetota bacterium]